MDGTPIGEAQAFDEAQKLFFQIPDTMLKCAGLIKTNEEEYDTCIDMLFKFMILGRASKSIDGQFLMDWKQQFFTLLYSDINVRIVIQLSDF